jgi:hypothetical protein
VVNLRKWGRKGREGASSAPTLPTPPAGSAGSARATASGRRRSSSCRHPAHPLLPYFPSSFRFLLEAASSSLLAAAAEEDDAPAAAAAAAAGGGGPALILFALAFSRAALPAPADQDRSAARSDALVPASSFTMASTRARSASMRDASTSAAAPTRHRPQPPPLAHTLQRGCPQTGKGVSLFHFQMHASRSTPYSFRSWAGLVMCLAFPAPQMVMLQHSSVNREEASLQVVQQRSLQRAHTAELARPSRTGYCRPPVQTRMCCTHTTLPSSFSHNCRSGRCPSWVGIGGEREGRLGQQGELLSSGEEEQVRGSRMSGGSDVCGRDCENDPGADILARGGSGARATRGIAKMILARCEAQKLLSSLFLASRARPLPLSPPRRPPPFST